MRFACLALLFAACDWTQPDTAGPLPDAGCDDIGGFEIAAPQPDLHYASSLAVYIDEAELQGELQLTMTEDTGTAYQWTNESFAPYPGDAGPWWSRDRYDYELAPGHRYTLVVSHCTTQSVTFFTSSP